MGNDAEFDVFLCHNSEDKDAVIEIAEQLEERGLRPWLDEWELPPGLSWQLALEQQIEQIATAAVFVGESGLGPWQKQEIYAFLNEFVSRGCPVIPVILQSAPKRPALPIFLKNNTWVDFRRQRPDPMERLTWGVTGKKPARKRRLTEGNTSSPKTSGEDRKRSAKPEAQDSVPAEVESEREREPVAGNTSPSPTSGKDSKGSTKPKAQESVLAEVELVSAVGMDYSKLRDFLATGKWKEADDETLRVMLAVAKREQQGWLDRESIESFPCEDLRTIDQLWVKHSDGRFGFSVQKKIWEEVGGSPQAGVDEWRRFGDRVQWCVEGKWRTYSDLTFNTSAPHGHLPAYASGLAAVRYVVTWFYVWKDVMSSLAQRLVTCSIRESTRA